MIRLASLAAGWSTARRSLLWFHGTHKRADKLAVNLRPYFFGIEAGGGKEVARFFALIDSSRLDVDSFETGAKKLVAILILFERASDAADPQLHTFADLGGNIATHNHIGNGEAAARPQNAKSFLDHSVFASGEIDHAVGNNHVHGIVGKRNVFDSALQKFHVRQPGLLLILPRQHQHLVSHVQSVRFARWANTLRRKQNVNSPARHR